MVTHRCAVIGSQIGPYRIVRPVGQGGMGAVYEANHQQLGRRVAIKVLLPTFATHPEVVARFFNEARAVNVIDHPGLVQITEFGQLPDGSAYLVMEYLQGETLGSRLKKNNKRLSEPAALRLTWQLASILAATHDKGIVHRDIKPGNIMLVPDEAMPEGERVKLLDFGIAKLAWEQGPQDPLTRTGTVMGTALYMSPEQCRGAAQVDGRADVYSLGVLLYQMLAGRPPFIGTLDAGIAALHMYEPPPPLREFAPMASDPAVTLVHRMLVKEREERPTMREVATVLSKLVGPTPGKLSSAAVDHAAPTAVTASHDGTQATNPSTLHHSVGQMRNDWRQRPLLAAGLLAILGTLGLFLYRPWQARSIQSVPSIQTVSSVVHISIVSTPPNAEVVRVADSKILGTTPLNIAQESSHDRLDILVRLGGYQERKLTLDLDRDSSVEIALVTIVPTQSKSLPSAPIKQSSRTRLSVPSIPPQKSIGNKTHAAPTKIVN